MKFYITFLVIALFAVLTGCGGTEPATNQSANANAKPSNSAPVSNSNDALEPVKKTEAATTNDAPTIAPVVAAYYEALRTKNAAKLKDVLTTEHVRTLEAQMKEDGVTDFVAFVGEYEKMTPAVVVRNEQITGDRAIAELKGGTYTNWTPFYFVKENGKWKLTGQSPDTDSLRKK